MVARWLLPEPSGPTSSMIRLGHSGQASTSAMPAALAGPSRKLSRVRLSACGSVNANCQGCTRPAKQCSMPGTAGARSIAFSGELGTGSRQKNASALFCFDRTHVPHPFHEVKRHGHQGKDGDKTHQDQIIGLWLETETKR